MGKDDLCKTAHKVFNPKKNLQYLYCSNGCVDFFGNLKTQNKPHLLRLQKFFRKFLIVLRNQGFLTCGKTQGFVMIKSHSVFCIKYRKDLFLEEKYINSLKNICIGIQERYSIKFETIGFDENYIHFMLQALPRFSPLKIFQIIKSVSAIKLFENFPEVKKELWGGEFWNDGVLLKQLEKK